MHDNVLLCMTPYDSVFIFMMMYEWMTLLESVPVAQWEKSWLVCIWPSLCQSIWFPILLSYQNITTKRHLLHLITTYIQPLYPFLLSMILICQSYVPGNYSEEKNCIRKCKKMQKSCYLFLPQSQSKSIMVTVILWKLFNIPENLTSIFLYVHMVKSSTVYVGRSFHNLHKPSLFQSVSHDIVRCF